MEISNHHLVGVQGGGIVIMVPPCKLTKDEALLFAAWLVTLADADNKFKDVLAAVQNI